MPECLIGDAKRLKQVIINLLKLLLSDNLISVILVQSGFNYGKSELKIVLFGKRDINNAFENNVSIYDEDENFNSPN